MPSSTLFNPHKPLLWIVLVAAAAAFFVSGALAARATLDDSSTPADSSVRNITTVPPYAGPGYGNGNIPASFPGRGAFGEQAADGDKTGAAAMDAFYGRGGYWGGCRTPLPGGTLGANGIDLGAAGFQLTQPGAGYSLLSLSVGTWAECDENGQPKGSGEVAVDSAWRHNDTGLEVYISQRANATAVAPVLRQDWAAFSTGGYQFNVSVNRWSVYPARSDILPYPDGDPRATEVLNELVGRLAPNIGLQCFWTEAQGDWGSLASLGIGDPRPAVPSGYSQNELWVTTFNPPAAGCDRSITPTDGASFSASWSNSDGSYIGVSAWAIPADYPYDYPGQVSVWGANWSNGRFQFSVYVGDAYRTEGDLETIRAIARALDSSYNEQCFIQERILSDGDLASLGFRTPAVPDGYSITRSYLSGTDIGAGCQKPAGFEPYFNLSWSLTNGGDTIDVSVSRYSGSQGTGEGWISDYGLNWSGSNGDYFAVNGWSNGISPVVSQDILIAVAKSLDPNLDVNKLNKESGGGVKPMPLTEPGVRGASAGSTTDLPAPDSGR